MARPRRQDARRAEIINAAALAIAERGLVGLRIKDIAAAAGLSPGSVAYYYPELDDLLLAVHEAAVTRFYRARRDAIADVTDPMRRLGVLIDLGICDPDDPMSPALYELHLHSARADRHAELMTQLFEREASLYREVIDQGVAEGVFTVDGDIAHVASAAIAIEDGFGLHLVGRNRRVDPAWVRASLRQFLAAALGCPGLV
ncbi:TetR/AcrR family transcriptional regulator [Gordonia rhizosphera]|uniref:Putative TetR family transcriptional regulator n=1 Tax=Gordonia rhizosphera NBRC 16068 TaxID=1108045 RepID=K6WGL3_9ACTN|nr:TetR/AcrR family transcriptional regulator [Gordonia rhizosphera]GAB92906.1 putative TetR family transcriptional regulator [Gordonia rhizosphera NBRC 16068]